MRANLQRRPPSRKPRIRRLLVSAERYKGKNAKASATNVDAVSSEQIENATGSKARVLQLSLLEQLRNALWLPNQLGEERQWDRLRAAIALLEGIRPQDEIEGMLAVQMAATHNAALECLRRAMLPEQTFAGRENNLKHGAKLLGIYVQQLAALDKRRGKGQQKVTVEYVNVESGGQAIVGHVEHGKPAGRARRRSGPNPRQVEAPTDEAMKLLDKTSAKERTHMRRRERKD
jgi:hypothetical protein